MTMLDLVPLLGVAAGGLAGYGLWLYRRRRAAPSPPSSRAQRSGAEGPVMRAEVQGPLLHEVPGGRYGIGDNSASRAEIEAFMARRQGR